MEDILLNLLRKEQNIKGFLSEDDLKRISKDTKIPISKLYGVATFYSMLNTTEQGKFVIELCSSPSCYLNKSFDLEKYLIQELKIQPGETTKDKLFTFLKSSCIGCCNKAPAMLLNKKPYFKLNKTKLKEIIKKCKSQKKLI